MQPIHPEVVQVFGNHLRVRVCGILIENNSILLVNHQGLNHTNQFWSPPGGGLQFGESAPECLQREFKEETGLTVEIVNFLFINEFISSTLHAIELFFEVKLIGGTVSTGTDPELQRQIIREVKYLSLAEIQQFVTSEVHSIFHRCNNFEDLIQLKGYYTNKV